MYQPPVFVQRFFFPRCFSFIMQTNQLGLLLLDWSAMLCNRDERKKQTHRTELGVFFFLFVPFLQRIAF